MKKVWAVLLSVCLLSVFLFGCDAVFESNPTSSTTSTTTTTTETTTTTTTTTSTTTTTVPTTTTTAKRLTPQEAVAIVKGKLPPEKASYMHVDCEDEKPIVFDEDWASFSGRECYYIHVYSLSEELLDGDQGPYRLMFTYAWLYVDVQTREVFKDAPSIDDPEPLVPWPGEETR